jgi:hypothetical protein
MSPEGGKGSERDAGRRPGAADAWLDDEQIFAITAFVALRLASSMINDSLGAQPDTQLAQSLPQLVREAVTHGRPVAQAPSV